MVYVSNKSKLTTVLTVLLVIQLLFTFFDVFYSKPIEMAAEQMKSMKNSFGGILDASSQLEQMGLSEDDLDDIDGYFSPTVYWKLGGMISKAAKMGSQFTNISDGDMFKVTMIVFGMRFLTVFWIITLLLILFMIFMAYRNQGNKNIATMIAPGVFTVLSLLIAFVLGLSADGFGYGFKLFFVTALLYAIVIGIYLVVTRVFDKHKEYEPYIIGSLMVMVYLVLMSVLPDYVAERSSMGMGGMELFEISGFGIFTMCLSVLTIAGSIFLKVADEGILGGIKMQCPQCGAAINPGVTFCTNCGASIQPMQTQPVSGTVCPNCQMPIAPGAVFCTNCGTSMNQENGQQPSAQPLQKQPEMQAEQRKCPHCGAELAPDAVFCTNCGTTL